ncbi:MAG TPA: response regulator [Kofleriaceae bacterium]|nr:response regulator [Kofleriaceae bacterium]
MARILVVDDELDIVRMVTKVLASRGHQVEAGRDGVDAVMRIRRAPPDLVLIDAGLPGVDGVEICRRIKSDPETKSVPVVMLTAGEITLADVSDDSGLGADGWVIKPFVREVLLANVERLLPPAADRA